MKMPFIRFCVFSCLLFISNFLPAVVTTTHATTVSYSVASLGGDAWEYSYSVTNDSLSSNIEEFSIFFDVGLFDSLQSPQAPTTWDPIVVQPDPGLPDGGFYDALSAAIGIAPGETLAGFTVRFDYFGAGVPGSQFFQVFDPNDFSILDSGMTTVVPLPAAVWLFGTGIFSLFFFGRRSKKRSPLVCTEPVLV